MNAITHALLVTLLLTTVAVVEAGDGSEEDMVVPEGAVYVVADSLHVGSLVVLGTLVIDAPEGATIHAQSVHVGPVGVIEGAPGPDGADARTPDATGAGGEAGTSFSIVAQSLLIEDGGRIQGGAGGRGGRAEGAGLVTGGTGGNGGAVSINTITATVRGFVLPGAGGDGGDAIANGTVSGAGTTKAFGGRGGDNGRVRSNGLRLPAPLIVRGAPLPPPTVPCSMVLSVGEPGVLIDVDGGAGGHACALMTGIPGGSGSNCGDGGGGGTDASTSAKAGDGGGALGVGFGGAGGIAWAFAWGGPGGNGGGCSSATPGSGGAGGGGGNAAADAQGGRGGEGPSGGGRGGCAYIEAKAGKGGNGGAGKTIGNGGNGGNGGIGTATAVGGNGGESGASRGGDGGCVNVHGESGDGGKGGACVGCAPRSGGTGGNAGTPTDIRARGGSGGSGDLAGGRGGHVRSTVDPEGGDGGVPGGMGGRGGDWSVISLGGNGGASSAAESGGPAGISTNEIPLGTGAGGIGGDGNPSNSLGFGFKLVNVALPGIPGLLPRTLPDTTCKPQVGVGPEDIPHAYYAYYPWVHPPVEPWINVPEGRGFDGCPTTYSGELGFGFGGVWLFSRTGAGTDPDGNAGGDGVEVCYGVPSTGHHGGDTTIRVADDTFGGSVAFMVTRDWNRTATNPVTPSTNSGGAADCGDNLVEPCTAAQEAQTDPTSPDYVAGGCNHLDASEYVFPADGLCTGFSGLGEFVIDPRNPSTLSDLIARTLAFVIGLPDDAPTCTYPGPNSWTVPAGGDLSGFAGADGAVMVNLATNAHFEANHFGTGTTGAVWTEP